MSIKTRSNISLVLAFLMAGCAIFNLTQGEYFDAADNAIVVGFILVGRALAIRIHELQQENQRLTKALNDAHRTFN